MIGPCQEYRSRIEAGVDGELPADAVRELSGHVSECDRCAAYEAQLVRLREGLGQLALARDGPDFAGPVVRGLRRGLWARFALLASVVVLVKLLDVVGVFGSGFVARAVVAGSVILAFCLLRIDPFRLVRPEEFPQSNGTVEGVDRVRT